MASPPANGFQLTLPINAALQTTPTSFQYPFEFGIAGRGAPDYTWIYVVGCIFSFTLAASNGANDCANSFATSVGSKALKMWHAIIIAAFCEFLGAFLLGARTTATIRANIVNINSFKGHDDLMMVGMCIATIVVTLWVFLMSYYGMPVSITHSIVGAIIGFALCSPAGNASVDWTMTGMGKVIVSWFVSPVLSGIIAAGFFSIVRKVVLRHENSFERALRAFPVILTLTFWINITFIIFAGVTSFDSNKGTATLKGVNDNGKALDVGVGFGIATGVSVGLGLLLGLVGIPYFRKTYGEMTPEAVAQLAVTRGVILSPEEAALVQDKTGTQDGLVPVNKTYSLVDRIFHQPEVDAASMSSPLVQGIHDKAEKFPIRTELVFSSLQVLTACFASFAHGSNDVANSVGPLSAIVSVYQNGANQITKNLPVSDWVLLVGCSGLVVGLALYGHKVIASMGHKMIHITPVRGFCAELSFSFVVVFASFLGLPVSTTHCIVGAITGVGVAEGNYRESVNWKFLFEVFGSWIGTLVVCGFLSALVFSFATFSPSQIYPLSHVNCLYMYGKVNNQTKGAPNVITFNNTVYQAIYGYPSTAQVGTIGA